MAIGITPVWHALSSLNPIILVGIGVVVLLIAVAALRVLFVFRRLRRADRLGREASAGLPHEDLPLASYNRKGQPGDPVNVEMIGSMSQVGAAFGAAGWYRADEIDLVTSVRISVDSVLGRKYSTAPVSNLYLYGRKEDLAFERPGRSVRERDHIRLWNTGRDAADGQPIWIGGATRDTKVEVAKTNHLPTHKIAPDIDAERDLVVSELAVTGWVVEDTWRPGFGKETRGVNGTGDPWYTDGQVAVLTLANVWAPPLAAQIRSPLGASVVHAAAGLLRWRLPRKGRERAQREHARQAERAAETR
jgi:LssY C-terminus